MQRRGNRLRGGDTGRFFFVDIQHNQVGKQAESMLRLLASRGEGAQMTPEMWMQHFPGGVEAAIEQLLHRDLIELVPGGYRFQVELIRRWFARQVK